MRTMVLAGLFALTASTTFGQTNSAPGPANLCQELVAFMEAPSPKPASQAKTAAQAEKGGSAQEASGQGGPANMAPEQNATAVGVPPARGSSGDNTTAQNAQQSSGLSAPVPTEPASTPKTAVMTVAEAQKLAGAGDIAACRDAARKLRIAGVAMPPPLLALTALDLRYHRSVDPGQ